MDDGRKWIGSDVLGNVIVALEILPPGEANPLQAWTCPWGSRRLRLPEFLDIRHMEAVRLLAPRIGRLYPTEDIPVTHFY